MILNRAEVYKNVRIRDDDNLSVWGLLIFLSWVDVRLSGAAFTESIRLCYIGTGTLSVRPYVYLKRIAKIKACGYTCF